MLRINPSWISSIRMREQNGGLLICGEQIRTNKSAHAPRSKRPRLIIKRGTFDFLKLDYKLGRNKPQDINVISGFNIFLILKGSTNILISVNQASAYILANSFRSESIKL